jgi:hypothetical protein
MLRKSLTPGTSRSSAAVRDAVLLLANGDGHQADFLGELQQALEHGRVSAGMAHDLADVGVPNADGEVQGQELLRPVDEARQRAWRQRGVLVVNTVRAGTCLDASGR